MAANRFQAFTQLVGDEHGLPPTLPPTQDTNDHKQDPMDSNDNEDIPQKVLDAFGNLQTFEDLVAETPYPEPSAPEYAKRHIPKAQPNTKVRSEDAADHDFTLDPRKGEPSGLGMSFCPFLAIAKFPYKYVAQDFWQPIATAFFDAGKIYDRSWDLYYVWSEQSAKAITLIPLSQAQNLIDEVNAKFDKLEWKFDLPYHAEEGLLLEFDDPNPDYRPRFLGSTDSRSKFDFLVENADPYETTNMDSPKDRSLEAFKEKMALAADAAKNKNKKQKKERLEKKVLNRQGMGQQLRQAQRYLGLIPPEAETPMSGPGMSPINVHEPAAYLRDSDVVIIAIDVEAYEKAQGIITEVGVSTLDTRDLQGIAPGTNGQNWQQFVRGRHFRVIENKNYVNGQFVAGCPESFEFGETEWASFKGMASVLTQCFHEPFSKRASSTDTQDTIREDPNNKRNIVLLGHDIGQDIQYCHKLGLSVLGRGNMLATIDTKAMYQAYTRDPAARGLGGIMSDFNFAAWHLHNAGNDAVYTIWAMLATCVQDAAERGTDAAKKKHEERAQTKFDDAVQAAMDNAEEDAEGWDLSEDGGVALPGPARPSISGRYTIGGAPLDI